MSDSFLHQMYYTIPFMEYRIFLFLKSALCALNCAWFIVKCVWCILRCAWDNSHLLHFLIISVDECAWD